RRCAPSSRDISSSRKVRATRRSWCASEGKWLGPGSASPPAKRQARRRAATEQTASQLRARVDELVASRETLLTRVVEWQRAVRAGDPEALDLAEFIASLRHAVLDLERDNALGERREAALREQLEQATAPAVTPA